MMIKRKINIMFLQEMRWVGEKAKISIKFGRNFGT